ncbi:hypothetical protein A2U01_0094183, partial [Trifolium medium]|nr:hypothetical protein [Trifolium medium]
QGGASTRATSEQTPTTATSKDPINKSQHDDEEFLKPEPVKRERPLCSGTKEHKLPP